MFTEVLGTSQLKFVSETANAMFPNVWGDTYGSDYTFVNTLRALMVKRIGNNSIHFRVSSSSHFSVSDDTSVLSIIDNTIGYVDENEIVLHFLRDSITANETVLNVMERDFVKDSSPFKGFRDLPDLKVFIAKKMNMRVFINEQMKTTIIMIAGLNNRNYHLLQSVMPRFIPWYFGENNKLNEDEILLCQSLNQRDSAVYIEAINRIASKIDFRSTMIDNVIGGFAKRSIDTQIDSISYEIRNIKDRVENLWSEYTRYIRQNEDLNLKLVGLKASKEMYDPKDDELVAYFRGNKHLLPVAANNSAFSFIVLTRFNMYDVEMYKTITKSDRCDMLSAYTPSDPIFSPVSARRKFFDAIISDEPKMFIRMCAYYQLNIRDKTCDSQSGYMYPSECDDYIPNPHLHYHRCLGNHRRYICEALCENDIIGAIAQCEGSASAMNVGESITSSRFVRDVLNSTKKIIELEDGTLMTPKEAYQWLCAQDNKEVEAHE